MVSAIGSTSVNPYLSLYKGIWEKDRVSGIMGSLPMPLHSVANQRPYNEFTFQNVLQRFNQKTQSLYASLSSFSFNLEDIPQNLRTPVISDSDAEKLTADATSEATVTSYLLDIDQLAAAKTRQSRILASDDITDLEEGSYSFTLTVGDNQYSLGITIDKTGNDKDTNKDVLRKIKWAIDSVGDDIDTDITEIKIKKYNIFSDNYYEDASYLTIRSKNTGQAEDFSVEDDSGDIVGSLDLNKTIQSGRASAYKIDTHPSSASENTVSIDDDNLTITFLDTTGESVGIRVRKGLAPVAEKLVNLISSYNDYIDWLDLNAQYISSTVKSGILADIKPLDGKAASGITMDRTGNAVLRLTANIKINDTEAEGNTLTGIGLELKENGQIEILDEFSDALENKYEAVGNTLAGDDGLFSRIAESLKRILDFGTEKYGLSESRVGVYNQQGYLSPLSAMIRQESLLSLFI